MNVNVFIFFATKRVDSFFNVSKKEQIRDCSLRKWIRRLFIPFMESLLSKSINSPSRIQGANWITRLSEPTMFMNIWHFPLFIQKATLLSLFLTQVASIFYCLKLNIGILELLEKFLDSWLWQIMGLPFAVLTHKWLWSCNINTYNVIFVIARILIFYSPRLGCSWKQLDSSMEQNN